MLKIRELGSGMCASAEKGGQCLVGEWAEGSCRAFKWGAYVGTSSVRED